MVFDMGIMYVVSEYSRSDVKMLPIKNTGTGFVQRYRSMYANVQFIFYCS